MTNIAIVVLDTLRNDQFRKYFSWLNGTRFTNAYSTSHWTGSAHASLFTGHYPSEIGTTKQSWSLDWDGATLPEALESEGYRTRMITTNMHIHRWDGWERGFDERHGTSTNDIAPTPEGVFDWAEYSRNADTTGAEKYVWGILQSLRDGYSLPSTLWEGYRLKTSEMMDTRAVMKRIQATDFGENEFLFVNVMDAHKPYKPPETYRETDENVGPEIEEGLKGEVADPDLVRRAYDKCAQYLSHAYRRVHSDLLDDFDYIITLADHGEHLGEDLDGDDLWTHVYGLAPELAHIPLVISGEDVSSRVIDTPVSILDVHQTVLDLAGNDVPSRGQDLLADVEPRDRLVEYHGFSSVREERFKEAGLWSDYDWMNSPLDAIVASEGYAQETHNGLVVSGGWDDDGAGERLADLVDSIDRHDSDSGGDDAEVSDSVRSRLEELGYA